MTLSVWALMSITVLLAGFVQGSTGFGFALIVAPMLGLFAPALMPVSLLMLMLPLNFMVAWRDRDALQTGNSLWITMGRIVGTLGGMALIVVMSTRQLNALTGIATIIAAVLTLLLPVFQPMRSALVGAGFVTGVTETTTGIGGPPLALVYQHQPAAAMRSTLATCFLIGELLSLAMLWAMDRTNWQHVVGALLLVPALMVGVVASKVTHVYLSPRVLRFFVVAFSITSGTVLLVRS